MRRLEGLIRRLCNWLERYSQCKGRCRWILHCFLAASSVVLSFELNSSGCIRILKSTFLISCFARTRCFWFKIFNSVAISSPKISHLPLFSSADASLLITWSALNYYSSILDFSRFLTFNFVFSIFPVNFRFRNGVSRFSAISFVLFFQGIL